MLRIIEALLKKENSINAEDPFEQCSHEHLENLCGTRAGRKTTLKQLDKVTVNFFEDQHQPSHIDNSIITRLISGEPISIPQKGDDNFVLIPYATLLFSVNEVIDFKETGLHITDRFVVVPFAATFTDKDTNTGCIRNIDIVEELCKPKALQIILTRAIQAFDKVLQNSKFTIPDIVQKETSKYFMSCNSALEFCNLLPITTFVGKMPYYKEYCRWCNENHYKILSSSQFGKQVIALGYKAERYSFKGIRNTYYANPTFDTSRRLDIYSTFTAEGTVGTIKKSMTFEKYLCLCLYREKVNRDSETETDEETIDFDQLMQDEQIDYDNLNFDVSVLDDKVCKASSEKELDS